MNTAPNKPLIEIKGLKKSFGSHTVLKDISLQIERLVERPIV